MATGRTGRAARTGTPTARLRLDGGVQVDVWWSPEQRRLLVRARDEAADGDVGADFTVPGSGPVGSIRADETPPNRPPLFGAVGPEQTPAAAANCSSKVASDAPAREAPRTDPPESTPSHLAPDGEQAPPNQGGAFRLRGDAEDPLVQAQAAAVARVLDSAIRAHSPTAPTKPDSWVAMILHALTLDGFSAVELAQAARFAHHAPDRFWRPLVLSGRTLRKYAARILEQRGGQPAEACGPPVLSCAGCGLLIATPGRAGAIACLHRHTWFTVEAWQCAGCQRMIATLRPQSSCPECTTTRGQLPIEVGNAIAEVWQTAEAPKEAP